jgi:orotidine-5'-phosphate decarboxylase
MVWERVRGVNLDRDWSCCLTHFVDRLNAAIRAKGNAVLVGMDPRLEQLPLDERNRIPSTHQARAELIGSYCSIVLELVAPRVPAVKFQAAFYECLGPPGMEVLGELMEKASRLGLIVIFDGKRNDIGSTAEAYAAAYLDDSDPAWRADAVTINPYLGTDGVLPFAQVAARNEKGVYVLVRTSNASARDFQDLVADGRPVYRHVAEKLLAWGSTWRNSEGESAIGAVVGATYPAELAELRHALPGVPFLIPGYGAQGGGAVDVAAGFDSRGLGALVNNSRGILFAHEKPKYRERFADDWQSALIQAIDDMIGDLRSAGIHPK